MSVDWEKVRERLRLSSAGPTRESRNAILEARARRLAVRPPAPESTARIPALFLRRGGERWAIPLSIARAVIPPRDAQAFPADGRTVGLASFRGRAVPVTEPGRAGGAFQLLIVVDTPGGPMAIAADAVDGVGDLPADAAGPLPDGTQILRNGGE